MPFQAPIQRVPDHRHQELHLRRITVGKDVEFGSYHRMASVYPIRSL